MACCDEDVVSCFDEGVLECLYNNNKDDFDGYFSMSNPCKILLRKPWVGNYQPTMFICSKLAGVRPKPTSVINITIKIR